MDARLRIDYPTSSPCPAPAVWANELVRTHSRLVERIARRVFHAMASTIPIEDLIQIGNIALLQSARTFVDRGTAQFSTYANIRIRGAMIDELRKSATISREALRLRRQFTKARHDLSASLGRAPNDIEMAGHVNMAVGAYQVAINSMQTITYTSIDDSYSDTSSWFADTAPGADEIIDGDRRREKVAAAIAKLPEREQTILQLFFVDECSLEQIGKIFGVSPARICQIKRAALEGLRGNLRQLCDH